MQEQVQTEQQEPTQHQRHQTHQEHWERTEKTTAEMAVVVEQVAVASTVVNQEMRARETKVVPAGHQD